MAIRLKEMRERAKLTQEKLADLLNTTHATIQRWETGKRNIPSGRIQKLARVLGCHPGEIFEPLPIGTLSPTQKIAAEIAANLGPEDAPNWLQIGASLAKPKMGPGKAPSGRRPSAAHQKRAEQER